MTFEEMREKVLSLDIILQMQAYNDFYADPYGDYTEKRLYPWFDEEGRYNTIEQVARLYKMEESEIFMLGVNMQIRYGDDFMNDYYLNFARLSERSWGYEFDVFEKLDDLGDDFDEFIKQLIQDEVDIDEWERMVE